LMVTVCLAMGFDSMTAMGIVWMAAACGYSGGFTNAFTVGVAQGIAGLPLFSGMWLRIAAFVAFLSVSIVYVTMHAIKVRKNPESSPVYEEDKTHVVNIDVYNVPKLTIRHKLVLLILVGSVVALIVGVTQFGFYIDELSAVFLIAGVLAGIVGGLKPGEMTDEFIKGCGNLLWAGMAIGLCGAATYILQSTNIIDTVIHFMSGLLQGLPAALSACGMFVVQNILNILIPSGSGQAAVTMPIMAPLSDVLGVTRQTAVLAFQFGDSFTNVVTPTCATLMAALSMAKVPWGKWIKFLAPLYAVWVVITFAFLIFAVKVGYGPF
ncbi:YfcC family protein, partial [[Clostridium] symbiosum]